MSNNKTKITEWAKSVWDNRDGYVILDTETTGLDGHAEVLQIGVIDLAGNVLVDTLIRPFAVSEWLGAQRVHGIGPDQVVSAPWLIDVEPLLKDVINEKRVLVYNAPYDSRVLSQSIAAIPNGLGQFHFDWFEGLEWVDVMNPYAVYWGAWHRGRGGYKWQKLTAACCQQGITVANAHDAVGDCQMTLALIKKLAEVNNE